MPTPALPPLPASITVDAPLSNEDLARIVEAFGIDDRADALGMPSLVDVIRDPATAQADPLSAEAQVLRRVPEDLREFVTGYRLADTGHAEWAMRHLRDAIASVETAEAQALAWHDEIDRWLAQATKGARGSGAYFHGLLMDYGHRRRSDDDNAKTLPLPSGVVETTRRKPAPKVWDEGQVVAWALEHAPDAVEVVPAVNKVPAKAAKALGSIVERDVLDPETNEPITTRLAFVATIGEGDDREVVEVPGMAVTPETIDVRVKPGPANVG